VDQGVLDQEMKAAFAVRGPSPVPQAAAHLAELDANHLAMSATLAATRQLVATSNPVTGRCRISTSVDTPLAPIVVKSAGSVSGISWQG
jgi:hypothetical protein